MKAKVALKSDSITPFGGIFYALDEFSRLRFDLSNGHLLGPKTNEDCVEITKPHSMLPKKFSSYCF